MAKILISPLGVGRASEPGTQPQRRYRDATYTFNGETYPNSPFVASVIYENLKLDGIIFIGTVKSMWEEVYYYFSEKKGLQIDEEYWLELCDKLKQLNHKSSLELIDLSKIESILGKNSRCILIKYGLNEDELWGNFDLIIEAIKSLQDGDEIFLDITHAFRSLSLFQFLSALFVEELFPKKRIKISGVYYGMLEVQDEFEIEVGGKSQKYAPIVDLKPLFDMTSWLRGIHNLNQFGNGYLIADLLREKNQISLAKCVEDFSEVVNINYLSSISQKATDLRSALKNDLPTPLKYIAPGVEKFTRTLGRNHDSDSAVQLRTAEWYFENKRYATCYIVLAESLITYVCEVKGKVSRSQCDRDLMKECLHKEECGSDLAKLFFDVNKIRNAIAHALLNKSFTSYERAISQAKSYLERAKNIFSTGNLNLH